MKNVFALFLAIIPLIGFSQSFDISTKDAKVEFVFLGDKTKGTLNQVEAKILINPKDLANSRVVGSVNVATLNTGNNGRDKHLKSDDFFDVEKYPKMKFSATSIEKAGEHLVAKGQLTIKEMTKEVSFVVKNSGDQLMFVTKINAHDYGVSPKKKEKSEVDIIVLIPLK